MGQTLTHGIYLPDEGERNCYSGLAANWQLLDTSVGTVAEHTTQIAGKAPLVHTHTKADITDFPAYGTTAGTICEGNDSRLSDARTPVAHTHGKADITDLFNSANTWTKNQVIASSTDQCYFVKDTVYELGQDYSSGEHLGGLTIQDKNGTVAGLFDIVDRSYGNMELRIRVQQKFDPDSTNRSTSGDILFNEMTIGISSTKTNYIKFAADLWGNNTYSLGTSSNQWNNLYAKNYYYNGTQWGLDQANTWTNTNTFRQNIMYERTNFFHQADNPCYIQKDTGVEKGSLVSAARVAYPGLWHDKNSDILGYMRFVEYDTGRQTAELRISNLVKDGVLDPTGSIVNCGVVLSLTPSGGKVLVPEQNNEINLGTSTNKWKTLNGVNPGALSLPSTSYTNIDISAQGLNWDLSGSANTYTPDRDGWVEIWASRGSLATAYIDLENEYIRYSTEVSTLTYVKLTAPVRNGQTYKICVLAGNCYVRIIKAEGNV